MAERTESLRLLEAGDLQSIHDASLAILAEPGMKIQSASLRNALQAAGAHVDQVSQVVRFPAALVERTLEALRSQVEAGRRQIVLNGVVASLTPCAMAVKFGGACIEVYDWATRSARTPRRTDLVELVRLGEALPEVGSVGNPLTLLQEDDGRPVDPRLQRVKTAALVARYTTKAGATEVWTAQELKYLMELGQIVRGTRQAYLANPCFVTAKETISPLVLEEAAGDVLLLLAQNDLPCTLIPMPVGGSSSPLTRAANVALGNAEILGTFTALRAACPTANCVGGVISGTLDMRTGAAVFGGPEAVLQDLALAEVHQRLYGFDFGVGGYLDAKYPGAQSVLETMGRCGWLARSGRYNVPVGLLNGGKRFSPEKALVDIEVERWIVEAGRPLQVTPETLRVEQVRQVGIGGHSMAEEHTLQVMRRNVWYPALMDRSLSADASQEAANDMIAAAARRARDTLARDDLYQADPAMQRAIEAVERAAERELAG